MPTIKIQGEEVEIDFWREDIPRGGFINCVADNCERAETYVNIDDVEDVLCNTHRLEMSPGARRRYVKIEDIPFKNPPRSAAEIAFNGEDPEIDDEDYELSDEDVNTTVE